MLPLQAELKAAHNDKGAKRRRVSDAQHRLDELRAERQVRGGALESVAASPARIAGSLHR
jgi:hypothetical protein